MKIGMGYDIHRLVEGRNLILGGVKIPYEKGLLGHSDADVLIHAIIDALLGATGNGDIGSHFPDTSDEYKDEKSTILLRKTHEFLLKDFYKIQNIDCIIIAEEPKMAPYIPEMRENIRNILKMELRRINIKAKTNEKVGPVGRGEAIVAYATVLVD